MSPRIFEIHVVDVGPMPEAPADPTPSLARFVEEEVERRLGLMTHQLDGAHTRALRAEAGWQSAVDDFNRARARITEVETERDTVQKQFERMTEAADSWRAKYMEAVADPADLATLRRERDEALAAVEEWKAAAARWGTRHDEAAAERDEALKAASAAELQRKLMRDDRDALIEDMGGARDRAIAERDEARASLAMSRATVTEVGAERDQAVRRSVELGNELAAARARFNNLCNSDRNAAAVVALTAERDRLAGELSEARKPFAGLFGDLSHLRKMEQGLRVRLAEAETRHDEARKALAAQIEKTNECARALNAYPGVAELAALRARVAELEATIEAAKVNPLTLFGDYTVTSCIKAIDEKTSFVGLAVDVSKGGSPRVAAIKELASWL